MMKKLFFVLTYLLFFYNQATALDCSAVVVNPKIKTTASYGKLEYIHNKNTVEITEIAKNFNILEKGIFAHGLSTVNINFDITINTLGHLIGNSEFCVTPTDINIFLGMYKPIIYISSELEKDSCEYKIVLHHEQVHQQINKTTLEYYLPMFKYAAEHIIKQIEPIHITDIDDIEKTTAELTKIYNKKLNPLVDYIKREMLKEQQKLDNNQNYIFESSICSQDNSSNLQL